MAVRGRFTFQKTNGSTTRPNEGKRTDSTMAFLCSIVLLALAGGIHSSSVPGNFSFEIDKKPFEVITVRFGDDAVLNCKTNNPNALVTLKVPTSCPNNLPDDPQKITRDGATFTIHNIIVCDGGSYQCVAERKDGKKITRKILLHIDTNVADIVIIPFEAKRVVTGSNLKYACESSVRGSITWYRVISKSSSVALPAPSLPGISIKKLGNNRTDLVFSNAGFSHSGDYKCELTYRGNTLDRRVQVQVLDPQPAKIVHTSNLYVWAVKDSNGDYKDITLVCDTTGFPSPTVTWKKNNKAIKECFKAEPCAKTERYTMSYNYDLEIVKPRYDDDAVFRCEVQNAYGSDQREFVVVVPTSPELNKSKLTYTWAQGRKKPIDISCGLLKGSPKSTFTWSYRLCNRDHSLLPPDNIVCFMWMPIKDIVRKNIAKVKDLEKQSILEIDPRRLPPIILSFKCTAENGIGQDDMVIAVFKED